MDAKSDRPSPTRYEPFRPLSGAVRLLATFSLALAAFMNILDLTIANVSVPTIAGAMGVSPTQGTWIVTSYAVSEAILLPLTGWLATRFGQRRLFMWTTGGFVFASLLCAMALSFPMLLGARVMQGALGAAMIPLAQAMLLAIYPPEKRGVAIGIFAMTTVAAPIIGPLAGGWITEHLSWQWIFLINLPIGLICMTLVWSLLGRFETDPRHIPLDVTALVLLAVGVASLQIMLDQGNQLDWFGSPWIVTLAVVAVLALVSFVIWTLTAEHPLVNLRLFTRRNFTVGVVVLALASVAFFGANVVVPLWLQTHMNYNSEWAGRTMAFGGMLAIVMGPLIGIYIQRIDARLVATFGLAMYALFSILSAQFPPDVDFWTLALTRLIMGIGLACLFLPLNFIYLAGLSAEETAGAAGLSSFMRNLGSSFGTSIMVSLWDHRTYAFNQELAERVVPSNPAVAPYLDSLHAQGFGSAQALDYLQNVVISAQASLLATNWLMITGAWMMFGLMFVVWFARPPFGARHAARAKS
jgi:DHA2 family multidrug resistance protein